MKQIAEMRKGKSSPTQAHPSPLTSLILPLSINQYPSSLFYNQSIKGITSSKIEDKFSNVLSDPNKQRTRAQK